MTEITIDLSAYSIQLICPDLHVSTRDAFSTIVPRPAPFDLRMLGTLAIGDWKANISNDFETTVFQKHPVLADIKAQLYAQGAVYASMSGTGSAIYGIFMKGERAIIKSNVAFRDVFIR